MFLKSPKKSLYHLFDNSLNMTKNMLVSGKHNALAKHVLPQLQRKLSFRLPINAASDEHFRQSGLLVKRSRFNAECCWDEIPGKDSQKVVYRMIMSIQYLCYSVYAYTDILR